MKWYLYRLAFAKLLLLSAPFLLLSRGKHYRATWRGRLGRDPGQAPLPERDDARRPLWIHAVSVGEVGVASALAAGLPEDLPLVITTVTPTGQERARSMFRDRAHVNYLPLDLKRPIERFFARYNPRGLILIEGEFWPLLLHLARRRQMPVALVNGRISDRTYERQRRITRWFGRRTLSPLYDAVDRMGVQSDVDQERLASLGVEESRILMTGNLKYEMEQPTRNRQLESRLRQLAAGRKIFVAGSTMADPKRGLSEESLVFEALERLGTQRAMLVIAPRHPERFEETVELARSKGLNFTRRSSFEKEDRSRQNDEASPESTDVVILDTLGELAGLYAIADGAFVGGSLVDTGGHNPLEPASFATPVIVGPSMFNFREMAQHFDRTHAWQRVESAEALATSWASFIEKPAQARQLGERGLQLIQENRGALEATLQLLSETEGLLTDLHPGRSA